MQLGRYEIRREIARSNDIVWEGFDARMNRRVAVKELLFADGLTGAARRERIERFFREARAAGQLSHPNIVTIHEVAEDAGRYFIAMEYLEGQTLRQRLSAGGPLPVSEAIRIVTALADALDYAHQRGIVHRDIKPDNVHLLPGGTVKLTDFGIARILGEAQLTVAGQVFGTPSYMSPEQIRGGAVGPGADVFSLGILLWEMIAGRKPFPGDSVVTITYKIMNEATPPLPGAPPALEAVIRRATAKEPNARFAHAGELRDALAPRFPPSSSAPQPPVMGGMGAGATQMYGSRTQLGVAPGLQQHPQSPPLLGAGGQVNQAGGQSYAAPAPEYDPEAATRRRKIGTGLFATAVVLAAVVGIGLATKRAMQTFALQQGGVQLTEDMNLGIKLYNEGKYTDAAAEFNRLRRNGNQNAREYESYCYFQMGVEAKNKNEFQVAKGNFDKAIEINPNYQNAKDISRNMEEVIRGSASPAPVVTPEPIERTIEFPKAPAPGTPQVSSGDFNDSIQRQKDQANVETSRCGNDISCLQKVIERYPGLPSARASELLNNLLAQ